jgi:uncharacterized protein YjbI with pentapeptide repeats
MGAQPIPVEAVVKKLREDYRTVQLTGKKIYSADFSGQDLSRLKLRGSLFYNCNFDRADLTETDCIGSEFFGSSFVDSICYRTNFADAKLAGTNFQPRDCFGMIVSLNCKTFDGMRVSPLWFLGFLTFATLMNPVRFGTKDENLVDKLIAEVFGAERYVKLQAMFGRRDY